MNQRIIVSGILLNEEGKVFVARRPLAKTIAPGLYHLPGGHVEFGETPAEALVREFQEEFKIHIDTVVPERTFSYVLEDTHTVGITFLINTKSDLGNVWFDPKDNESVHWLEANVLKEFFPDGDHDLETLETFFKK